MSFMQENVQENQPSKSPSRPQQRKPRGLAMLFFLLGGLVIAGGWLFSSGKYTSRARPSGQPEQARLH